MKRLGLLLVFVSLAVPVAEGCISIYVHVDAYAGSICCTTDVVWSNATVSCRDYFGNPWASYMYLKHLINRNDLTAVSGRYVQGFHADWSSTLFYPNPDAGSCYRGYAEGDDNLGTMQGAGSAQTCYYGPPSNEHCERFPEAIGCGDPPPNCPLIVNTTGGPWRLTGTTDGVLFDLDADGVRERVGWTRSGGPLEFVALDVNANGLIDDGRELFGDAHRLTDGSIATNGFIALAEYDANGDGFITDADPVWSDLFLWNDRNHNGVSETVELRSVRNSEIAALDTSYTDVRRTDQYGNQFRMMSRITMVTGRRRLYFDVFFVRD